MSAPGSQQHEQPDFAVAADTSWATDAPCTLKSDDSFAIFGRGGDMAAGAEGFYHRDTRHLSQLTVTCGGAKLRLLSAAISDDNSLFVCDLACPAPRPNLDMGDDGNEILLRRETFLWRDTRHDQLAVTNFSALPQRLHIGIGFAADFADLFEIRGTSRVRHGEIRRPVCTASSVIMACRGLDGALRRTTINLAPKPDHLDARGATYTLELGPGETRRINLAIRCATEPEAAGGSEATMDWLPAYLPARRAARRHGANLRRQIASLATGNTLADAILRRARDDLVMLTTATEFGPYPYAGVPWFSTAFGRDAIITALQVLWLAPGLARGVLGYLAANQATATDPRADAEPGKILHEARDGDMARGGEVPFHRYYGSVDSTPLFVMLAGAYLRRTGDLALIRGLWPNIEAALRWIDDFGDADGDGFVEYGRQSQNGLVNQGWKDSRDSVFHADGALARGPIALCEVQGYVYAARQAAAGIAAALGDPERAAALTAAAAELAEKFDAAFWDERLGFYVLALDGEKAPCRVLASNAGHALFTGIARPYRACRVADRLMGPEFFSGWGIRTLGHGQPRYNPMSYHNGSVWPHDNGLIGLGLARYGRAEDAARLCDALFAAAAFAPRYRLPELFCGLPRGAGHGPTGYPVACAPQAWAAATLAGLLDACCGLEFDLGAGTATAQAPVLPATLSHLRLNNLDAGAQRIALCLSRTPTGSIAVS
jgi:glycogen debranching enzyme